MDLKVVSVGEQGNEEKEYVALSAKEACNLKGYIIFDETFKNDGSASNKHRHVFIFPSWEVKKGELILVFTRPGKDKRSAVGDIPVSNFYWGLKSPVWNEEGDNVHLIKVASTITFKVPSVA